MKRTLTIASTTAAILVGAMSSAFAMDADHATKIVLKFFGYSDSIVSQLDSRELSQIASAMHNGDDTDAIRDVNALVRSFTN